MLPDAELFVMAEVVLEEVLGRIREADRDIVVPAEFELPGLDGPTPMGRIVALYAYDDASAADLLSGRSTADLALYQPDAEKLGGGLLRTDWQAGIGRLATAARTAASQVSDGDLLVGSRFGPMPARDYLRRLTVARSLLAHYVAAYLGSTACPLPEELARPLWEATAPEAETWRARGVFHAPLPLPPDVSWRDRFLLSAGHQPHPLGH